MNTEKKQSIKGVVDRLNESLERLRTAQAEVEDHKYELVRTLAANEMWDLLAPRMDRVRIVVR